VVINGSRVILSGIRRDNCVYSLDGHAMAGELNASVEEKDSLVLVWHKRLGHISEAGLQVLKKQGLFSKKILAFGKFKEWKQLVENQTGRTVKKLKTDNGLEFSPHLIRPRFRPISGHQSSAPIITTSSPPSIAYHIHLIIPSSSPLPPRHHHHPRPIFMLPLPSPPLHHLFLVTNRKTAVKVRLDLGSTVRVRLVVQKSTKGAFGGVEKHQGCVWWCRKAPKGEFGGIEKHQRVRLVVQKSTKGAFGCVETH
nr:retrovirus-related Pol polyprotein from transposon TNT 1-94 [Tanacetum cinerariifolium]